ncbi:cbb3-type cytochrome c oxidase subunit I [Neoehrlichia mikurensis]|uniref:Cbb3-type cytochrome c oxidase subunit I n=1 Tax=Neoehrlichia mikurensis TaxID=89586 RepID=A0A9Q9F4D3_9RICK|nr:cbb3-type cytochrome c oxidase subunit I [Neoehrlichia mikurensis]QXK91623.1 cbb3-type cytochrome c oxidase subunit I [Neoehrlichia mikurensis]QXK92834.1 cbb3-type cytochrome c oxidase subunit I [Neoehrlichia mikurensis]QXK93314.1 cbb3-type cytochrome c oxidase subunit I [Neoehrlichia mikurensis]UTO55743.1 cbb3-type cytochrome c oxidase subunit I [Neoehrlichia mikurensis]UTO56660.1 cbb3-type cytochrome c oxidase subunit I [Neoehrlichia mikurensis]
MKYINNSNIYLCKKWLFLGVCALSLSGILSVAIVFLRLPFLKSLLLSYNNIFDISLVIHVNLSVLVWMCSIIAIISNLMIDNNTNIKSFHYLWLIAFCGTILIILSAFIPNTVAVKNNYIPVIDNFIFFTGLWLFLLSITFNSILSVTHSKCDKHIIFTGVKGIAIMFTIVMACFIMAYATTHKISDHLLLYENLFWGGGHLLQAIFSQALLIVYIIIINNYHPRILKMVLYMNTISVVFAIFPYALYSTTSPILTNFFTWHMRIAEGIIPTFIIIFALYNIRSLIQHNNHHLLCSIILFTYGGILGIMSVNGTVTIPAHYHGSIVGMSIAFMGFIYWLMPKLNLYTVHIRLSTCQIYIYSIGQFLHITGLQLLGGYGTLRKVAYLPNTVSILAKICFAFGGIMAIIGGCLFAIILLRAYYKDTF